MRATTRAVIFGSILSGITAFYAAEVFAAPPTPQTPVSVDTAPLTMPPTPGAQNTPDSPPPSTPAANDPFDPLSGSPQATAPSSGSDFDPFAANNPAPAPAPANTVPLAIPNSPLSVPPPTVAPAPGNLVQGGGSASTPFGAMQAGEAPPEMQPPPAPVEPMDMPPVAEAPKPKPKPKFKPSMAAGKKAFDKGQFDLARRHFAPFATKGDADAQYHLGVIYSHSKNNRNYQKSAEWYDKASMQGMKEAQFNLGFMLYQGAGTPGDDTSIASDPAQAAKYLMMAANQNVPMAQHLLSLLYLRGQGVAINMWEALRWSAVAAEAGIEEAMFNAAMLAVRRPDATMHDYIHSYKWFTLLTMRGYPGAAENRYLVAGQMPYNAIQQAEYLAQQWQPSTSGEQPLMLPQMQQQPYAAMPAPMPVPQHYGYAPDTYLPPPTYMPLYPHRMDWSPIRPQHPYSNIPAHERYMMRQ